jgi:HEAT repeat protein
MRVPLALWITFLSGLFAAVAPPARADDAKVPPPEKLVETLRNADFVTRQQTLEDLAANQDLAEMYVPTLRLALKDKDRAVRQQAAIGLAGFGIAEQGVLDQLVERMGQAHSGRYQTQPEGLLSPTAALVKLGKKAVPCLLKAMDDESSVRRLRALVALGEIGPDAKDALPAIERALEKREHGSLVTLVDVKWRIDRNSSFALVRLVPLLADKRNLSCYGALGTLSYMRADAKEAVPALIEALKRHKDTNVLRTLRDLAPYSKELAVPALQEALREPTLADEAAIALQGIGLPGEEVLPSQLRRLRACQPGDGNDPMRIVYTIAIYEPANQRYLPAVRELLKHANPEIRRAAAWGVCRIAGDEKATEAALKEAAKDPEVAEEATRSLKVLHDSKK